MNALDVYLHRSRVGTLERGSQARLDFAYEPEWVKEGTPLSLSLPLRADPFSDRECEPFFAGLLPEGEFLKAIARAFHVSAGNAFALLAEIGGECAGAVSLTRPGGPPSGLDAAAARWLSEPELAELLASLPQRPLLIAADRGIGVDFGADDDKEDGIRLSLAGTHEKLGVLFDGERVGISRGTPPTTHILKTPIAEAPDAIANEGFCMTLAAVAGLEAAETEPRATAEREYLLVRRYDRDPIAEPDRRLHQEDFCQALGFVPALKYEAEGGPGAAQCGDLLRRTSSAPARDVIAFLDALLFNFLIGNHDAHSKNYSLLLEGPGAIRLAPLYDLMSSWVYHGTSGKLAMKVGNEYRPEYLRGRHLRRLAAGLQVRPALITRRGSAMIERALASADEARARLPGAFGERAVIEQIIALLSERGKRLAMAIAEI